jgi:glycosyltransferase involved in cell wall biosynthesis
VYDAHELYPEISTLSAGEARVWRAVERRLIRRADRVVTVCESIADELVARYGVDEPLVLLNCPPLTGLAEGGSSLRERLGLDDVTEPIVLYQGGFAPNRGLPELVRAAGLLDEGILVLMGWGSLEGELRQLTARLGLERRVRFAAPVPRSALVECAAGADVGVIPYEPVGLNNTYSTPNKLFDFMAAGLPIVASDLPELARFVGSLGIGVTFPRVTPELISAAIESVLADDEAARQMGANGRKASRTFCWEVESAKLVAMYSGLGTNGGPTPSRLRG